MANGFWWTVRLIKTIAAIAEIEPEQDRSRGTNETSELPNERPVGGGAGSKAEHPVQGISLNEAPLASLGLIRKASFPNLVF